MEKVNRDRRLIIGLVILVFGGLLLANNFNLIPYELKRFIWRWEMILIGIGIINLATREHKSTGIILVAIGFFFMLPDIIQVPYNFRELFWPLLIILVGVLIITKSQKNDKLFSKWKTEESQDLIDDMAIFGGGDRIITTRNFKGGRITSIFGGSNLNLVRSDLAPGTNYIEVFIMFGGTKLIVPEDWSIKIEVISIFGAFVDKRIVNSSIETDIEKKIVIKGITIFGGGEIKNF